MRPEIQHSVRELADAHLERFVLRDRLLEEIGPQRLAEVLCGSGPRPAERLLGALAAAPAEVAGQLAELICAGDALAVELGKAPLAETAAVISAARGAGAEVAARLTEALGGQQVMIARFRRVWRWMSELHIADGGGESTAVVRVAAVEDEQPLDWTAQAVELARLLLSCFPSCERCDIETEVLPGVPVRIGAFPLGLSKLERRYEPGATQVAWNRQKLRLAAGHVCAFDSADWLHQVARLLAELAKCLHELAQRWLRGNASTSFSARFSALGHRADGLPALMDEGSLAPTGVLAAGQLVTHPFHLLARGLTGNLAGRIDSASQWPDLVGFVGDVLPGHVKALADLHWRLAGMKAPPAALGEIAEVLEGLRCVFEALTFEPAALPVVRATARSGPVSDALRRAVAASRETIAVHRLHVEVRLREGLKSAGFDATIRTRPRSGEKVRAWQLAYAIAIEIDSLSSWPGTIEAIEPVLAEHHDLASIVLVPTRRGRPLAAFAVFYLGPSGAVESGAALAVRWADMPPLTLPTFHLGSTGAFGSAAAVAELWTDALPATPLTAALVSVRRTVRELLTIAAFVRVDGGPDAQLARDRTALLTARFELDAAVLKRDEAFAAHDSSIAAYLGRLAVGLEPEAGEVMADATLAAQMAQASAGQRSQELNDYLAALAAGCERDIEGWGPEEPGH